MSVEREAADLVAVVEVYLGPQLSLSVAQGRQGVAYDVSHVVVGRELVSVAAIGDELLVLQVNGYVWGAHGVGVGERREVDGLYLFCREAFDLSLVAIRRLDTQGDAEGAAVLGSVALRDV